MPVRQRPAQAAAGLVAVLLLASTVSALEINLPDISLPSLPEGWKLPSFDLPSPTEIRDFLNEKRQQAQQHLETALVSVTGNRQWAACWQTCHGCVRQCQRVMPPLRDATTRQTSRVIGCGELACTSALCNSPLTVADPVDQLPGTCLFCGYTRCCRSLFA
jgi:hypothetical protein